MTQTEFFIELAALKRTWSLNTALPGETCNQIRDQDCCCPVVAVARGMGIQIGSLLFWTAGQEIHLDCEDARQLAMAADGSVGYNRGLRKALLEICGLKEETV